MQAKCSVYWPLEVTSLIYPVGYHGVTEFQNLKLRGKNRIVAPVGAKGFDVSVRGKLDPRALGAALRRLREEAGVTVSDLAGRMGWHTGNVSRLERGGTERGGTVREPTFSSVALYLRTLGYQLTISAKPMPPLRKKSTSAKEDESDSADGEG